MSGIYISLLAALTNFSFFIHKTYIFTVVEYFGLYIPQLVLTVMVLIFYALIRDKIMKMDNESKKSWSVSDNLPGAKV